MAKEWILNSATNRFQLNFKKNVGAIMEAIRECSPKNINEWETYYYKNIYPKDHLIELGKKLFIKITEVIDSEVKEITEQDCIDYIINLVIYRSYEGYTTEIDTIYGQLQKILKQKIVAASDEWDRLYNVDFYIKIKEKYIGLQIKPVGTGFQLPEIFKEKNIQENTHNSFLDEFGGNVFYIYSKKNDKGIKEIQNKDVIDEIKKEIERLNELD